MSIAILPTSESHFEGLYQALDEVAHEKRYLAFIQAPPVENAFAFFRNIVASDLCQVIAVENGTVVGWCDVLPKFGDACAHVGTLGMGLIPSARHRGIGSRLLAAAIERAWTKGFSRIELSVRADNANAKALYERFGFVVEGINRRAYCIDGEFFDVYTMALLR
jgi:putative acetyltransferase